MYRSVEVDGLKDLSVNDLRNQAGPGTAAPRRPGGVTTWPSRLARRLAKALHSLTERENEFRALKILTHVARVSLGRTRFRAKQFAIILSGPLSSQTLVPHMLFQVSAPCQHACKYCAHGGLIDHDPKYQMSLDQLAKFLLCTRSSRYYIENLWMDGPGEPTLWKHLNEGIRRLYESGLVASINLTTNGQSLDRVEDATFGYLGRVLVTLYPSSRVRTFERLEALHAKFGFHLKIQVLERFRKLPTAPLAGTLPAWCACPGPMIYGDKVFLQCGPTGVAAGALMGRSVFEDPNHCVDLKPAYLDKAPLKSLFGTYPRKRISLKLCEYCWANFNIPLPEVEHELGRRELIGV